ncbi:MAG: pentapeptide repeat-containing protein [Nitrospiraceae bacterium]
MQLMSAHAPAWFWPLVVRLLAAIGLWGCPVAAVWADCTVERSSDPSGPVLTIHLSRSCSEAEREARAIPAGELMAALLKGKGVDLSGVVVKGDVFFDELPVTKLEALTSITAQDRQALEPVKAEDLHVIQGPFVLTRSRVDGRLMNRLKGGYLVITGPVILTETRFGGQLDLSRTVYLGMVDLSKATFDAESYFVQSRFTQGAMYADTRFGPHARFHRSQFGGPAVFKAADFSGLSELLEVVFQQPANFTGVRFHLGTGFSGARCMAKCDFSDARFEREAFFCLPSLIGRRSLPQPGLEG